MASEAATTLFGRLAERWSSVDDDEVPDDAARVARHCVLDWFACALAGSREPLSRILVEQGVAGEGPGPATLVGRAPMVAPRAAALVNGAAGHALDFDDTHMLLSGHPTAPVLPALLALAEEHDAAGLAVRTALVAGIEVECRVGALVAPGHYRAGWHATGTIGTIGAAAACARLLRLDAQRTAHALALAATQAAGLKASFGTMAKPLHAGKAAADGLLSARLAAAGFTGNPALLEAPQGLGEAAGGGTVLDSSRLDHLAGRWTIRDVLFKYHAACYLTHASINAALALRSRIVPRDIDAVEVHVAADSLKVCNIAEPATGLEGKFSLRATTAMALLGDDTTDTATYSDTRMRAPDLIALRDRVTVVPEVARAGTCSKVTVLLSSGDRLEAEDDTGVPAGDLAVQEERLASKFLGLAVPVIGAARARRLRDAITQLDTQTFIGSLTALARP